MGYVEIIAENIRIDHEWNRRKDEMAEDLIPELAQKLYEEDGHMGSIYRKASVQTLRFYEDKAQEIICPECGQPSPDDDRVKVGMKCGKCAGY